MKTNYLYYLLLAVLTISCSGNDDALAEDPEEVLVGQDGNPRFNLQFTNSENVDLDLYVRTPSGEVIYFNNPTADKGELDVDCECISCPQGPNENIYWENGTAPSGEYQFWVEHFESCGGGDAASQFTLRVIRNGRVMDTKTGNLSSGSSNVWTWTQ
ncbi:MAG: hypothetical protein WBG71_15350 [Leeuwenhoekiella sp.]